MAIQVQYKCDSCGYLLDPEKDIIKDKELTIEQECGKVSVLISVSNMSDDNETYHNPALCCTCMASLVKSWNETGVNFVRSAH